MKYGLEDRPPLGAMLLYGAQWWAASLPCVVIMGLVAARLQFADPAQHAFYLQKLFALTGLMSIAQILFGHRLPLVPGPAAILLVGVTAAADQGAGAVNSAVLLGGAVFALISFGGLVGRLRFFFTPRIVSLVLIMIAVTLTPTILNLALGGGTRPAFHLAFTALLALALAVCNKFLPGVMKSLTVVLGIAGGSLIYFAFMGAPELGASPTRLGPMTWLTEFEFHAGTVLAFLLCFTALLINELGSIESLGRMIKTDDLAGRIRRGAGLTGLGNVLAGGLGVVGSVDYSLSAGVIAATGNASRFTLIPAGIGLILCALSSEVVMLLSMIPGPVMAGLMLYLMSAQLSSGLAMLVTEKGVVDFESGLTVALPLMTAVFIAFAPPAVWASVPGILRPIVANGFVMGAIMVILLEHVVLKK